MTAFDLVFLATFLVVVIALARTAYLLLWRRTPVAVRTLRRLGTFLGAYLLVLLSVSLLSPRRVVPMGTRWCFDDWCVTGESAETAAKVGGPANEVAAKGQFRVVTLRVSNAGRGRVQRATDAKMWLVDSKGRWYAPRTKRRPPSTQRAAAASR